jgi:uncharacterized protein YdaU (DUF1376 family)
MHYYQFHIGDYRRDTAHLTLIEHAIYRALIDTCFETEQPLPLVRSKIERSHSIRTPEESTALDNVLADFFIETEAGFIHTRIQQDIEAVYAKSEKARESARKRWEKKANAMRTDSERNANACEMDANASKSDANGMLPITHYPIPNNPITKDPVKHKPLSPKADDAQQVFDYWCSVFNKSTSTKLTPKRKAKVIKRLEDGYTLEDIKSAIDGCSRSAHHMGQNDSGTIYDDIELICRTGEKLEQFMTNYNNAPAPKQTKSDQSINNCQEWATDDRTGQSGILEINAVSGRDIQQDDHSRLTDDLL